MKGMIYMKKFKVEIDPGHGGKDRANRGPTGYIEADGVLQMSMLLEILAFYLHFFANTLKNCILRNKRNLSRFNYIKTGGKIHDKPGNNL